MNVCRDYDSGKTVAGVVHCVNQIQGHRVCYTWKPMRGFIRWSSATGRGISLEAIAGGGW